MQDNQFNRSNLERRFRSYTPRESRVVRRDVSAPQAFNNDIKPASVVASSPAKEKAATKQDFTPPQELNDYYENQPETLEVPYHEETLQPQRAVVAKQKGTRKWRLKAALVTFVLVLGGGFWFWRGKNSNAHLLSAQTLTTNQASVNEINASTTGAPKDLKTLKIDSLSFSTELSKSGTDIKPPKNDQHVNWLGPTLPTDAGKAVVLTGQATEGAVFANLKNLQIGDKVTVEQFDGTAHSYEVLTTRIYHPTAVDTERIKKPFEQPGDGLNLVAFDETSQTPTVLVVFALKI